MTPKVKSLVWEDHGASIYMTIDDNYTIYRDGKSGFVTSFQVRGPNGFFAFRSTLELAQSAAQADHAVRIIAALDPAWLAGIEAMVKASDELAEAARRASHATTNDGITGPIYTDEAVALQHALATYRAAKEASHE